MIARLRSVLEWMLHKLDDSAAAPSRPRKSPARVASAFDSLEKREVLSTATLAPFLVPNVPIAATVAPTVTPAWSPTVTYSPTVSALSLAPTAVATPAPAPSVYFYGQPSVQAPVNAQSSALSPLYHSGLPSVLGPATGLTAADGDAAYVQDLYHTVLGREGSANEVAYWLTEMGTGLTPTGVAQGFVNSVEHRQDEVLSYYEEFLHRTPDQMASVWVNDLLSGASEEDVASAILGSPEYLEAHPQPVQFIDGLYLDVLGRQADAAGLAFWEDAFAAGATPQTIAADFVNSGEAVDQVVDSFYAAALHRQPEPVTSAVWANLLESPGGSASDVSVGILASQEFIQDSEQA